MNFCPYFVCNFFSSISSNLRLYFGRFMREALPMLAMDLDLVGGISRSLKDDFRIKGRGFNYLNNNKATVLPEKVLMAAVFYRALIDLESAELSGSYGEDPKRNRSEAINWFYSNRPKQPNYYTFIDICVTLDLDPGSIRRHLIKKQLL
jgi:hypothetical protein